MNSLEYYKFAVFTSTNVLSTGKSDSVSRGEQMVLVVGNLYSTTLFKIILKEAQDLGV